jgi:antitoxin component YwqK of YwqJK toxin-antitoxin module
MRILIAIIVAFCLWACDRGVVHVSRYPDGRIREQWTEKGPAGGPTVRDGEYRAFHPDGSRAMIVPYKAGKREGRARAWDERGRLSGVREWSGGFLVREIRYDSMGNSLSDRRFEVRTARVMAAGPGGDSLAALETCAWSLPAEGRPSRGQGDSNSRKGGPPLREGGLPYREGGPPYREGDPPYREGLCEMEYPDGKPMAERHFRKGVPDGPVKAWYRDGTPWIAGAYAEGLRTGAWKAYSPSGNPAWSAAYLKGERDGLWEEWFPDGQRKSIARYRAGKAEGEYREWYPNGRPRLRGSFSGGRREGLEEAWYPDGGRLYAARYAGGLLDGEFSQWHPGGKLRLRCRFLRGRKEGLSRIWYPTGALQEQAYYKAGRLNGPYRTWSPEGLPMAMKEYKEGSMAFDAKAKELLALLGADQLRVPAGMMGFYWGMGRKECRANLGLYQAARVRADSGEIAADLVAFPDRRPTRAHIRLAFNAQGELWGIHLDLRQASAADFFPLCENLEVEMAAGLGTTGLKPTDVAGEYAMVRKRDWGRFTVEAARGGIRQELPVLSAEGYSPGGGGWFRFALENNLYREYVDPASASVTPPRWEAETLFAGR